ncbi:MAG TPA: penicillin-binding protein activator [Stellaceae bacterium]|nr:penicillin-binding protein activator [Stellaceae bacterium]
MPRRCIPRFASLSTVLAALAALAACAPPMVPAPLAPPQPPYGYGPPPSPRLQPAPPTAAAPSGPAKIALLVPLSGPNAGLGNAILDAAQLALFETGGSQLTLVPRDTRGTPAGAADAARSAVGGGAALILGPLLAGEVEAVKPIARDAHVNVIAFSTVTDLAGGNTYLMGFLPRQEVVREVAYARQRGMARFAALAPNTPYGHLMTDALREAASSTGATVTKVAFFDARGGDPSTAIADLLPAGSPALPPSGPGVPGQAAPDQAAPAPPPPAVPSFDALLLPEGGDHLKEIARKLASAGLDSKATRLLGSGLWDVPDIGNDPTLDGGWFAASPPDARREFEQRYRATYGGEPPRLASLGYDAAALASALASGKSGPPFSRQAILNPNGFSGVDGLFRFMPDGLVQRGLAVLEVEPQGNVVVSPAPQSFQDLGY